MKIIKRVILYGVLAATLSTAGFALGYGIGAVYSTVYDVLTATTTEASRVQAQTDRSPSLLIPLVVTREY